MRFVVLISLAISTGCSAMPFLEKEAEEIIEFEISQHMVYKWWEDTTEDGERLKEVMKKIFKDDPYPYCLRLRKQKWPWGMC